NNFLNNVLLEISLLDSRVPESSRAGLAAIRKHANKVAAITRQFQEFWQPGQNEPREIEFDPIVEQAADAWMTAVRQSPQQLRSAADLRLDLSTKSVRVLGFPGDLRRLVWFLFSHASASALPTGAIIHVR